MLGLRRRFGYVITWPPRRLHSAIRCSGEVFWGNSTAWRKLVCNRSCPGTGGPGTGCGMTYFPLCSCGDEPWIFVQSSLNSRACDVSLMTCFWPYVVSHGWRFAEPEKGKCCGKKLDVSMSLFPSLTVTGVVHGLVDWCQSSWRCYVAVGFAGDTLLMCLSCMMISFDPQKHCKSLCYYYSFHFRNEETDA